MGERLIGIDAGTTRIKAVAFSPDGKAIHQSSIANTVDNPKPGWAEQDMEKTWQKTVQALTDVVNQLNKEDDVLGVGVTGQGDGCWLVDSDGNPIRSAILWSDGRANDYVARWQESGIGDQIYDICGSSQFPGSNLIILKWLKENEPRVYEQAATTFFCKDWIKYQLTGEQVTDPSDASLPFLDVRSVEYSDEVLSIVDMEELAEMLPSLAIGSEIIGSVTTESAQLTGLPIGTPVVSGFIDVAASALGSGAALPGDGSSVVGTTSLNQTILDEPEIGGTNIGYTLALGNGLWTRFMASMTGTPNLDWAIKEIMDKSEFDLVEEEVECVPIGCDGVLYHPFLSSAGERAPFLNPNARAQFIGLTQEHTQAHLVRAVYEGISLAMRDCYRHLPYETDEIYLSGGGAQSDFWCQMFADCLDARILLPEGSEFGAKGAALLAGVGVDKYSDLTTAVQQTSSVARSFEPRPENVKQYRVWYDVYRDVYKTMFDLWDQRANALAELRELETKVSPDIDPEQVADGSTADTNQ